MAASTIQNIHRIGEKSLYDKDMDFVENLILSRMNQRDKEIQYIIYNKYINDLESYWIVLRNYIDSSNIEIDIKNRPTIFKNPEYSTEIIELEKNLLEIRSKWDIYDDFFKKRIIELNKNFEFGSIYNDPYVTDIMGILSLFDLIGSLFCLNIPHWNIFFRTGLNYRNYKDYSHNEYPLTNEEGLFGINTWLYAFFNDILIVGIPNRVQSFDLETKCSGEFIRHDMGHNKNYLRYKKSKSKNIYYKLLNDKNLSRLQKELHILIMWIIIHEFPRVNYDTNPKLFFNSNLRKKGALIQDFADDFNKFKKFSYTHENIQSFLKFKDDSIVYINISDKNITIENFETVIRQTPPILSDSDDQIIAYLLAIWYSFNYIRTYFF